ncbi:uncharacterized protein krimp [Calliphora vicina]|uniref:uncharacterized protein krimp n=1 Tax=Calliphora vicina TaxID=7373 RepID=UPI00325BB7F5
MESTKEQMLMMHTICRDELCALKMNMEKFIQESERCQKLLNDLNATGGVTNIFGLIVFDRYMTQVVNVLNMARKFNIHLEINNLDQTVINASSNGCLEDANFTQTRLLKDFIEWRSTHLENGEGEKSPCAGRIKMAENVFSSYEKAKQIEYLELNENNSLVKCQIESRDECEINKSKKLNNLLEVLLPSKMLDPFKSGYEFNAYIVYVRDYKKLEFFICQMDDYKTLYDLSSNINFKPISRELLQPDDVFCVLEKKDTTMRECLWRAVIVPDEKSGESQKFVYLLDFGEIIPLTEHCTTFEAPQRYRKIPPLAIKCTLEGVEDSFTKCIIKDHEKCERALHRNEFEKASFRMLYKDGRVLHVVMLENPKNDDNASRFVNNMTSNPFLVSEDLENDDTNSSVISAALQLPRSLMYHASPTKQPVLNISADIGDKIQIIVTHVVSPISFYGIIQNDYCSDYKTFSWHDHQVFPLQKHMSSPPQLNDIILSQYVKDDYWYRARIMEIDSEKNLYKVFYVDFGNTEVVPLSSLAKCSKEQLKDPLRAVRFHLSNLSIVTISDEQNVSDTYCMKTRLKSAIENIVVMILDQILNVDVVERTNNDLVVRLMDTQYADIPKMLVDMGVVKEI